MSDDEWLEVGGWIYKNFDIASGLSFLPRNDHVYEQAPYQDCTEAHYVECAAEKMPVHIDWKILSDYEKEDNTVSMQTMACTADSVRDCGYQCVGVIYHARCHRTILPRGS